MILVTGATGNVGRSVVSQLLDRGADVRALTRDPGSARLPAGVEVVGGDLSDPDGLAPAVDGAVFLVWPFITADAAPSVLNAVGKQAQHIVYLSSMSVRDDVERQAEQITTCHAEMERLSGRSWRGPSSDPAASRRTRWAGRHRSEPRASSAGRTPQRPGR
jgi:uncharacterized protein YbjT (DUF2867 family)